MEFYTVSCYKLAVRPLLIGVRSMQNILGVLRSSFLRIESDPLYVVDALPSLQLGLSEEKASSHANFLLSLSGNEALPRIAAKVEAAIICLRDNTSIKAAMEQRHTFQLNDRFAYLG